MSVDPAKAYDVTSAVDLVPPEYVEHKCQLMVLEEGLKYVGQELKEFQTT